MFIAVGWLAVQGALLAQQPPQQSPQQASQQVTQQVAKKLGGSQEARGNPYVPAYGLVLLGIVVGILVVCRTSHRRDRARPEQYAESKVTSTD